MKKEAIVLRSLVILAVAGILVLLTQSRMAAKAKAREAIGESVPAEQKTPSKVRDGYRHRAKKGPAARANGLAKAGTVAAASGEGKQAAGAAGEGSAAEEAMKPAAAGESAATPAEKARQTFDALGEAWRESAEGSPKRTVTKEDQEAFSKAFAALNDEEKPEAIRQALDLVADENYAVVEPMLVDLQQSEEVLDILFSDMLNRPEEIKDLELPKIAVIKGHPMRAEALRILDVTGALEKP